MIDSSVFKMRNRDDSVLEKYMNHVLSKHRLIIKTHTHPS